MDWKETDKRLIRRGELILDPKLLQNPKQELKTMNKHKRGRNYHISNTYIQLLAAIRYLYNTKASQEHCTDWSHPRRPEPTTQASEKGSSASASTPTMPSRRRTSQSPSQSTRPACVHKAGGWIERKHGKKRRYVKLHFAVNMETHEVVSMEISTDDVHDVKALPGLVEGAGRNVEVSKVIGDGAYDSGKVYGLLGELGVEAVVKPRKNSRIDTRSPGRRLAVGMVRELGYEAWARVTGYGRRWAVETAYSTFKRLFGEHSLARSFGNILKELAGKVALYNMLVNM